MATLPPDFWTKPQPGGITGLWIGAVVGGALSFYLFPGGGRYSWQGFLTTVFAAIGAFIGMVVGMLIVFYFGN